MNIQSIYSTDKMRFTWLVSALLIGTLLPLQTSINGIVANKTGHPVFAAIITYGVGLLAMLGLALVIRPEHSKLAGGIHLKYWHFLPGILSTFYVYTTIVVTQRLGAALTFGLILVGQMAISSAIDHFGLFGVPMHPMSAMHIVGLLLLVGGVALLSRP